ncbi:DNA-binding transcriptional regulator, FrmR family [Bryocella elongata]|uniref:DNA-binding transcriptional regulator, FrmR family n=1 Tax=Bryocella elongata TaxID=863522 RepID=A0A1H5TC84_9BACT|nr:metal/formaldehyde-sensitive transcriptional repressor [Bryocella elongata]SEF59701.1 DNA-binding transcriptional regulator, FrmR family [Bryocella elongata]
MGAEKRREPKLKVVGLVQATEARERSKLLNRVKRIRGQITAVERALTEDDDCPDVLMQLAAARGAINSLMAEVLEDHIRLHVVAQGKGAIEPEIAEDLIDLVRAYLK